MWSLKGKFVTVMESESGSSVSLIVEVKGKGTAWAAGEDGILSVWDTRTMTCLGELNQHKYPVSIREKESMSASPNLTRCNLTDRAFTFFLRPCNQY